MTSNDSTHPPSNFNPCSCGSQSPSHWIFDGYGIPLCRVCPKCEASKRKRYRSDIDTAYGSDEPIDFD